MFEVLTNEPAPTHDEELHHQDLDEESYYEVADEDENKNDEIVSHSEDDRSISSAASSANAIEPSIDLQEREISLPGADNSSFAMDALPNVDYSLPPNVMYFFVKKTGKLSHVEAAYIILREKRVTMNGKEIWEIISDRNWAESKHNPFSRQGPSIIVCNSLRVAVSRPHSLFVQYPDNSFGLSELMPYQALVHSNGEFAEGTQIVSTAPPLPPLRPIFVWTDSSRKLIETAIKSKCSSKVRSQEHRLGPAKPKPKPKSDRSLSKEKQLQKAVGPSKKEVKRQRMLESINLDELFTPIAESTRKRKAELSSASSCDENEFRATVDCSDVSAASSSHELQDLASNLLEKLLDSAEKELKNKNWNEVLQGFQAKRRAIEAAVQTVNAMEDGQNISIPRTQEDGKVIRYDFYVKTCEM